MRLSALTIITLLAGCVPLDEPTPEPVPQGLTLGPQRTCADPVADPDLPGFVDVTERAGVGFVPSPPEGQPGDVGLTSVQFEMTGGLIVADLDGDGLLDLVFTDYSEAPRFHFGRGDLEFEAVAAQDLGVDLLGLHSNGGSAADVDGDGDLDLWFGTYGRGFLFENDGQGNFSDVTGELGVQGQGNQLNGSWADPDRDGDLDLYVAAHSPGSAGPGQDFPNDPDAFWIQGDSGRFTDVASTLYPSGLAGQGFVGGWFDADDDGWQDLYVVNDGGMGGMMGQPNRFFANDEGTLQASPGSGADVGMLAMGLAIGDMDNDGDFDLHVSDAGPTLLLRSRGDGTFTDVSLQVEAFSDGSAGDISWGTLFFDHDNDGELELYSAFGYMQTKAGDHGPNMTSNRLEMADQLWRRDGDAWTDIAPAVGADDPAWNRTALAVDLDEDGFAELITFSLDQGPRILRSGCSDRAWLSVSLRDSTSANRFGVGARIIATGQGTPLVMREIGAGNVGTMSGGPPTVRLGLNEAETVDLAVRWPDGETVVYPDVSTRRQLSIVR